MKMKMKINVVLLLLTFFYFNTTYSQDCKVLLETINETYVGGCKRGKADGKGLAKGIDTYEGQFKKGLPHGEGIYTWQDGTIYKGTFKKGQKEGRGTLIFKEDSIKTGFWKNDTYIGLYKNPYNKIDKSQNVSSYTLNKVQDDIHNLRFYIEVNQEQVSYPRLNFVLQSGQYQSQINNSDFVELTNVTFPIKLKVIYKQDFIEIEIFRPGLWKIKTDITYIRGLN